MHSLIGDAAGHLLVKVLWIAFIAASVFLGLWALTARVQLARAYRAVQEASAQRDAALEALARNREVIGDLEARLALQSDTVRLSMATIDERLAEARRAKAREARIKALLAADPTAGESRCETVNRRIGDALSENRSWSGPST